MHEVWRDLGIIQNISEQFSSMWDEIPMRRARVLPGKYGMAAVILVLKVAEIKE